MSVSQGTTTSIELETLPQASPSQHSLRVTSQQHARPVRDNDSANPESSSLAAEPRVVDTDAGNETTLVKNVKFKLISCCLCFFVAGISDGSIGALLPYLIEEYNISTSFVGVMYATSFAGWVVAAIVMPIATAFLGTRGSLLLGACLYALAQALRVWTPPYPLFTITFFFASLGQAFQDAHANTFVSSFNASHLWLGLIHAMYGLGLLVAPPIATVIASNEPAKWALYYAFPLGVGGINIVLVLAAFFPLGEFMKSGPRNRESVAEAPPQASPSRTDDPIRTGKLQQAFEDMKETFKVKSVWIISLFYFFYLGASFTIGGWIVVFLSTVRNLPLSRAGYVPTGYYAGVFLGRVLLPHPTHTLLGGEHNMLCVYSVIILTLQLIAWQVNSAIATSVAISLMGFFFGPFFASGMQVSKQVIPRKVRSNALGLIFVIAQLGASVFPALTGAIAADKGVGVLEPLAVALIVLTGVSWWFVPTAPKPRESEG